MYDDIIRFYRPVIANTVESFTHRIVGVPHYIIDRRASIPGLYTFITDPDVHVIARAANESMYHSLLQDKECARCKMTVLHPLDVLDYDIMPGVVDKYGNATDDIVGDLLRNIKANITVFDTLIPADEFKVDKGCKTYRKAIEQYPEYNWDHYDSLMVYSGIENYVKFKGLKEGSIVRYMPLSDFAFLFQRDFPKYYHDEIGAMIQIHTDTNFVERIYMLGSFRNYAEDSVMTDKPMFRFASYNGYETVVDFHGNMVGYIPLETQPEVVDNQRIYTVQKPYKPAISVDKSFDATKYGCTGTDGYFQYYCDAAGNLIKAKTGDPSFVSYDIWGYFWNKGRRTQEHATDFSLTSFCRDVGGGVYVTKDNIKQIAPLFCAACSGTINRHRWEYRAMQKSLPPNDDYLKNDVFCAYCIVYMVLSSYNHTKSMYTPYLHHNALTFDEHSRVEEYLQSVLHWKPNEHDYAEALTDHINCINYMTNLAEYDSDLEYNWWQMNTELNTFHDAPRWDEDNSNHPEFCGMLHHAEFTADEFLINHVTPRLIHYGFLS